MHFFIVSFISERERERELLCDPNLDRRIPNPQVNDGHHTLCVCAGSRMITKQASQKKSKKKAPPLPPPPPSLPLFHAFNAARNAATTRSTASGHAL